MRNAGWYQFIPFTLWRTSWLHISDCLGSKDTFNAFISCIFEVSFMSLYNIYMYISLQEKLCVHWWIKFAFTVLNIFTLTFVIPVALKEPELLERNLSLSNTKQTHGKPKNPMVSKLNVPRNFLALIVQ